MKSALALAFLTACGGQTLASTGSDASVPDADGSASDGAVADRLRDAGACVNVVVRESRAFRTDILIVLDMSGSMNCGLSESACDDSRGQAPANPASRWSAAVDTIHALVASPTMYGRSMALGFVSDVFPSASCEPESYARPHVPMVSLPEGATRIDDAMRASMPAGGSPLTPALGGAIDYAQTYDLTTRNHQAVVLLVTDGAPNLCDGTLAAAARDGFAGTPSMKTFVLGVGNTPELDEVALAGTGGLVHAFAPSADLAAQLEPLLRSIPSELGCDFLVPVKTDETLDYDSAVIRMWIDGNAPVSVGQVANAAACSDAGGWFYDVDPPEVPTTLVLCPQSCSPLQSADETRVELAIDCK